MALSQKYGEQNFDKQQNDSCAIRAFTSKTVVLYNDFINLSTAF